MQSSIIHDLLDYPSGRIVLRQKESEALLFNIKQIQATGNGSPEDRECLLELRDKLKLLNDAESAVAQGLMLLFGHKVMKDYVRIVWKEQAPLLIRSFVEQGVDPHFSVVTGLEKVRLHPPGFGNDSIPVFMSGADIQAIFDHCRNLRERYPKLATDNISELPNDVQFRHAEPAVVREIVSRTARGVRLQELERSNWLDMSAWKFTI